LRIDARDVIGYTSTAVLSEVAHRLMMIEAQARYNWTAGKVIHRLTQTPTIIAGLSAFATAVGQVVRSPIQVLAIGPPLVLSATTESQHHGLLSNDALIVAVMRQHGLTHLASTDTDFDRVPGITRYGPG
jgi:predicted nucleic acid-binding protein